MSSLRCSDLIGRWVRGRAPTSLLGAGCQRLEITKWETILSFPLSLSLSKYTSHTKPTHRGFLQLSCQADKYLWLYCKTHSCSSSHYRTSGTTLKKEKNSFWGENNPPVTVKKKKEVGIASWTWSWDGYRQGERYLLTDSGLDGLLELLLCWIESLLCLLEKAFGFFREAFVFVREASVFVGWAFVFVREGSCVS